MNQTILFIAYYSLDSIKSGPKVRINALSLAFKQSCKLIFINGTATQRIKKYFKIIFNNKLQIVDNIYIEPSTSTAWPGDLLFLLYLKYKKVNISIYIRDAYPKFPDFWKELNFYQYPLYWGWFISIWFYLKIADISYYPTSTLMCLFNHKNADLLPPGCNSLINNFSIESKSILYAGSISRRYGIEVLVDMMRKLRENDEMYQLTLVTTSIVNSAIFEELGIKVSQKSLSETMKGEDKYFISIIPRIKNDYNDLALPIKLFDYMSYGLPVIASDCEEQQSFIRNNDVGYVCNCSPIDFASNIIRLHSEKKLLKRYHSNVIKLIETKHSWKHRVEMILKDFQEIKSNEQ